MKEVLDRFEEKFERVPWSGCWIWIAAIDKDGYGYFQFRGVAERAHRFSYAVYIGIIPPNLIVCHSCHNPSCVNPAHLYLGSYSDNAVDRGLVGTDHNKNKTHCKRGHEYNEINTHITGKGERQCRICGKELAQRRRNAIREIANGVA